MQVPLLLPKPVQRAALIVAAPARLNYKYSNRSSNPSNQYSWNLYGFLHHCSIRRMSWVVIATASITVTALPAATITYAGSLLLFY
ncbi:MAG: hypothetical protein IPL54_04745 [Chitinophagaceae bacterium]|nr:hypothetical protein [Chitinophagaceae bacterium]